MYLTGDGIVITKEQIKKAFESDKARFVHSHRDASHGGSSVSTSLLIDGKDFDTRGQCQSVWEETWTLKPGTLHECLSAAHVDF